MVESRKAKARKDRGSNKLPARRPGEPRRRDPSPSRPETPVVAPKGVRVAGGMLLKGTPIEDYRKEYGLDVKREDLSCDAPPFSKTRGVYSRVASRDEEIIGVLDTRHSQGGWAVARACNILGKQCINYYPRFKADEPGYIGPFQQKAKELGAELVPIQAGPSWYLYHQANKLLEPEGGYMMPNALKLEESVLETAREVPNKYYSNVIIPVSSGTIAAGVILGFQEREMDPLFILHLGYSRSHDQVMKYVLEKAMTSGARIRIIDEKYRYKDVAHKGPNPPWPCNEYYDLKCFRWWMENKFAYKVGNTLFWNIG